MVAVDLAKPRTSVDLLKLLDWVKALADRTSVDLVDLVDLVARLADYSALAYWVIADYSA